MVETLRLVIAGDSKGAQRALGELDKRASAAFKKMDADAKKSSGAFGSWSSGLNKAANGAAVGFGVGLGIITKSVYDYQQAASQIRTTMRATGMDAAGASLLTGQWKRYGVEAGAAGFATKTLAKAIDEARSGNEKNAGVFERLGISVEELQKMSDTDAIFATRDALGARPVPRADQHRDAASRPRGADHEQLVLAVGRVDGRDEQAP